MAEADTHPCDTPDIHPRQFLLAIMHDRTLPLTHRIRAAADLLRLFGPPPPPAQIACVIRIGGIPDPIDPDDFCSDLYDCIKRNTPCPWARMYPHLAQCKDKIIQQQMQYMDVKGHA